MGFISKGFRMRRNHEAKQELGITTEEDRPAEHPERPLDQQSVPERQRTSPRRSLLGRLLQKLPGWKL